MIPIGTSVAVRETPGAVIALIVANVMMFLVQTGLPADLAAQFINNNALVPARYLSPGFAAGAGLDPYNYWPLLTSTFMHAGWLHLIINMWTLWVIGRPLEERLGALRFLLFYLGCGVIAGLSHMFSHPSSTVPTLGASGAIAGVLGGYALLYPRSRVHLLSLVLIYPLTYRMQAMVFAAIWFGLQIVYGLAFLVAQQDKTMIAWWAHIGGFLAGILVVKFIGTATRTVRHVGPVPAAAPGTGAGSTGARTVGNPRDRVQVVGAATRRRRTGKIALGRKSVAAAGGSLAQRAAAWLSPWQSAGDGQAETVEVETPPPRRGPWG